LLVPVFGGMNRDWYKLKTKTYLVERIGAFFGHELLVDLPSR
jgi:hypothetical protein